jgi:hypothetical protein
MGYNNTFSRNLFHKVPVEKSQIVPDLIFLIQ